MKGGKQRVPAPITLKTRLIYQGYKGVMPHFVAYYFMVKAETGVSKGLNFVSKSLSLARALIVARLVPQINFWSTSKQFSNLEL